MDTRRIILFVIFSFSVLFLWQAWQQEHMPPPPPKPAASAPAAAPGAAPPPRDVPVPSGTMFVWAPIPAPYRALGSIEFAKKLVTEDKVDVIVGSSTTPASLARPTMRCRPSSTWPRG